MTDKRFRCLLKLQCVSAGQTGRHLHWQPVHAGAAMRFCMSGSQTCRVPWQLQLYPMIAGLPVKLPAAAVPGQPQRWHTGLLAAPGPFPHNLHHSVPNIGPQTDPWKSLVVQWDADAPPGIPQRLSPWEVSLSLHSPTVHINMLISVLHSSLHYCIASTSRALHAAKDTWMRSNMHGLLPEPGDAVAICRS